MIRVDEENKAEIFDAQFGISAAVMMAPEVQKVFASYDLSERKLHLKTVKWLCQAVQQIGTFLHFEIEQ